MLARSQVAECYAPEMNYVWFAFAAALEISGCYMFWLWLRGDRSVLFIIPGIIMLAVFAAALTQVSAAFAGRAFAAYAGIYVLGSLVWLLVSERVRPTVFDVAGTGLCLAGTLLIMLGNRGAA